MDAPCKIQGSIHVFRLVNIMCPGKWVHISMGAFLRFITFTKKYKIVSIATENYFQNGIMKLY